MHRCQEYVSSSAIFSAIVGVILFFIYDSIGLKPANNNNSILEDADMNNDISSISISNNFNPGKKIRRSQLIIL